jgi:hypothetical protein
MQRIFYFQRLSGFDAFGTKFCNQILKKKSKMQRICISMDPDDACFWYNVFGFAKHDPFYPSRLVSDGPATVLPKNSKTEFFPKHPRVPPPKKIENRTAKDPFDSWSQDL